MDVKILKNEKFIGCAVATIVTATVLSKSDCVLGLATGSTPIPTYKQMIEMYEKGFVDYSKVSTFNLDEYIGLAPDHPQSYHYFMMKNLFNSITDIPRENIHVPSGIGEDIDKIGKEYDKMIEEAGGIDVQILGIGVNGHIAFNEPGDYFSMGTNKVDLTESTIKANARFFKDEGEVPKHAISMGIGSILKAKKIILIATGENKANAINAMVNGKVDPKVPASVLQLHGDVTVFCDEAAASSI